MLISPMGTQFRGAVRGPNQRPRRKSHSVSQACRFSRRHRFLPGGRGARDSLCQGRIPGSGSVSGAPSGGFTCCRVSTPCSTGRSRSKPHDEDCRPPARPRRRFGHQFRAVRRREARQAYNPAAHRRRQGAAERPPRLRRRARWEATPPDGKVSGRVAGRHVLEERCELHRKQKFYAPNGIRGTRNEPAYYAARQGKPCQSGGLIGTKPWPPRMSDGPAPGLHGRRPYPHCRSGPDRLEAGQLKARMRPGPAQAGPRHAPGSARSPHGRIAPWLELGPMRPRKEKAPGLYIDLSVRAIAQGVDPGSP